MPLVKPGARDNPLDTGEVWTYRSAETGELALLLFSDAKNKPDNLPPGVGIYTADWLRKFKARLEAQSPAERQRSPLPILEAWSRPVSAAGKLRFDATRLVEKHVTIDGAYVDVRLKELSRDEDLSRYIL